MKNQRDIAPNNGFVQIDGYQNYLINSEGVIVSNRSGKILKTQIQNCGYELCHLTNNGSRKAFTVHRLVAKSFIPNPDNKPQVNHKNGIKTDNSVKNLEWVDLKENMRHAFDTGLMVNNIKRGRRRMREIGKKYAKINGDRLKQFAKETSKPIIQLDINGKFIKEYPSIKSARKELNISNINKVLNGQYKQTGGFKWVLKEDYHE